jgi:hypothetical protein
MSIALSGLLDHLWLGSVLGAGESALSIAWLLELGYLVTWLIVAVSRLGAQRYLLAGCGKT